ALAAAITVDVVTNQTHASIDSGAVADARGTLTVHAFTSLPYQQEFIKTDEIDGVVGFVKALNLQKKLATDAGVANGLFSSWTQASADSDELSLAGSVEVLVLTNTSNALMGVGALINQDPAYKTAAQDVVVEARTDVQS